MAVRLGLEDFARARAPAGLRQLRAATAARLRPRRAFDQIVGTR
jgi:hypothetical protein